EAEQARDLGEVPIGALVISAGSEVLARAGNRTLTMRDPTAHAELLAIRAACASLGSARLVDCDLYVTLEPCALCAPAISCARSPRLFFRRRRSQGGAVEHGPRFFQQPTCHHAPEVIGGIGETRAAALLKEFFAAGR